MIPEYFAVVGAAIASLGGLYYLYDTIRGKTKPNRVTWLLWGLFPMVIFIAQRAQGVEGLSWVSFAAGFTPILILLASFINKKAYWKTEPRDYYLMIAAIIGLILWAITDNPNLAIIFSLFADLFAGLPTMIKAYKQPETESWIAYAISAFGFGISVLAIPSYEFENFAFVIYLLGTNLLLAYLASRNNQNRPATV